LDKDPFVSDEELAATEGKSIRGDENTPPNIKEPTMLIPAVCQPCKYRKLGSFAIRSAASFEI
jgi:hypothetical protein